MKKKPEFIFTFPDNTTAKVAFGKMKGNVWDWKYNWATDAFFRAMENKKRGKPKFGFWNSGGEYGMICADIDTLPDGVDGFPRLLRALENNADDSLVVTSSSSGKVKIFALVKFPEFRGVSRKHKSTLIKTLSLKIFETIFPPFLFELIDTNQAAFLYTFINARMHFDIYGLQDKPPLCNASIDESGMVNVVICKTGELIEFSFNQSAPGLSLVNSEGPHKYREYEGEIPKYLTNIFIKRYQSSLAVEKEKFLRILLASQSLISTGFDLPITEIGHFLGLKHHQYISRWIDRLISLEQLKEVSSDYSKGKHAKRYMAVGELKEFLDSQEKSQPSVNINGKDWRKPVGYYPPENINDRNWWIETWKAIVWHFQEDFEGYMKWFYSVPGWNLKDREKEAKNRHNHYMNKYHRKNKTIGS